MTALSGSRDGRAGLRRSAKLLRVGLGAHAAVLPEETSRRARRLPRCRSRRSATRSCVVVVGDEPVVERAPIVDLWIRAARRARRRGRHDRARRDASRPSRAPAPQRAATLATPSSELGERLRDVRARGPDLVGPRRPGRRRGRGARRARSASRRSPGAAPSTCPRRRTAAASPTRGRPPSDDEGPNPEPIGLLIVSGDEAAADPDVRALAERRRDGARDRRCSRRSLRGWADLVLPGTSYLERDGTTINLEGRLQRLRRAVIPPVPGRARVALASSPSASASSSRRTRAVVFAELSRDLLRRPRRTARVGERAPLPPRARRAGAERAADGSRQPRRPRDGHGPAARSRYRPLFSGPGRRARARAPVPAPGAEVELSRRRRATGAGSRTGDDGRRSARTAPPPTLRARRQPAAASRASCASPSEHAAEPRTPRVEVERSRDASPGGSRSSRRS